MAKNEKVEIRPLVNEKSVNVSPYLAERFGFSAALVIQKVHFWCEYNRQKQPAETHFKDGRWWMHKSHAEWLEEVPSISALSSMKRLAKRLKTDGVLFTRFDRKEGELWFALNYDKLSEMIPDHLQPDWLRLKDDLSPKESAGELSINPSLAGSVTLLGWGRHATRLGASRPLGGSVTLLGWERYAPWGVASRYQETLYIDFSVKDSVKDSVEKAVVVAVESPHPVNEKLYCDNIGDLPPLLLQKLLDLEKMTSPELVKDAIEQAVIYDVRKMAYIETIVMDHAATADLAKDIANDGQDDREQEPDMGWYGEDEEETDSNDTLAENLPPDALISQALALPEQPEVPGVDDVLPGLERLTPRIAWVGVINQLRLQLTEFTFSKWIHGLKLVSFADGVLTVEARSVPACKWLESRQDLFDVPIQKSGWPIKVCFVGPQEAALAGG